MTKLASQSLVDIQPQVDLLITHVTDDPRQSVRLVALKHLNKLALKAPHLWKYSSVEVSMKKRGNISVLQWFV